jgi:hypothetical protein
MGGIDTEASMDDIPFDKLDDVEPADGFGVNVDDLEDLDKLDAVSVDELLVIQETEALGVSGVAVARRKATEALADVLANRTPAGETVADSIGVMTAPRERIADGEEAGEEASPTAEREDDGVTVLIAEGNEVVDADMVITIELDGLPMAVLETLDRPNTDGVEVAVGVADPVTIIDGKTGTEIEAEIVPVADSSRPWLLVLDKLTRLEGVWVGMIDCGAVLAAVEATGGMYDDEKLREAAPEAL